MKRALLFALSLVLCTGASAQRLDPMANLKAYAARVLPRCPGGVLTMEPVEGGPRNFTAYVVTLRSSDKYCGSQKYLLHSPKSQQVVIGSVIPLPNDGRPAAVRITDQSTQMLGKAVKATVAPFPLGDGLKAVSIVRDTPYGPFNYQAFVDASEQFLIVGQRGTLGADPAKVLRDALGASKAAHRGTGKVEILELSDFQCPTCAHAHEKIEPIIRRNLGKLSYTRIDLPLFEHHEWALPAALAARAILQTAPGKYWKFVDDTFKNQEAIGKRKFDDVLKEWLEDNDVPAAPVLKIYNSAAERKAILDQVSNAFSLGIASTPTYIINGQIMGFGPDGSFTIEAINKALAAATPVKKASTSAKKKK